MHRIAPIVLHNYPHQPHSFSQNFCPTLSEIMAPATTWQMFIATQQRHKWLLDVEQLSALEILFSDPILTVSRIAKETASPTRQELEEKHFAVDCFRLH
jgi:hypothetical protein